MAAQRVERKRRESSGGGVPGWVVALVALVVGVALGVAYAWVIDPVVVSNALPSDLAPGGQRVWISMAADSYATTGDVEEARRRLQFFAPEEFQGLLASELNVAQQAGDLSREQRLRDLAEVGETLPASGEAVPAPPADAGSPLGTLLMACGAGLLAVVLLGAGAVVVTRMRQGQSESRRRGAAGDRGRSRRDVDPIDDMDEPEPTLLMEPDAVDDDEGTVVSGLEVDAFEPDDEQDEYDLDDLFRETADEVAEAAQSGSRKVGFAEPEPAPIEYGPALAEFVTRYNYGDDGYDISFPIETAQTEFLGECGVGISDVVNDDTPQEVTAFELWLFDKDDIRTVTKVLLSDYGWNNEEIRSQLAPKGELLHVAEGDTIDLETKSLRVRARIREVEYGDPEQSSYFERFVVELTAQQKQ